MNLKEFLEKNAEPPVNEEMTDISRVKLEELLNAAKSYKTMKVRDVEALRDQIKEKMDLLSTNNAYKPLVSSAKLVWNTLNAFVKQGEKFKMAASADVEKKACSNMEKGKK